MWVAAIAEVIIVPKFYGTFGQKHPFGGTHVQPIHAESVSQAEKAMHAQYGKNYCMVYTEEGYFGTSMSSRHERLPTIQVKDYGGEGYENLGFDVVDPPEQELEGQQKRDHTKDSLK